MGAGRAIIAIASGQHAVVSLEQLIAASVSRDQVRHRVEQGWLRREHRGVYLVGALESPHSRAMAAVLAYGGGALLSHYPAAVLWGLRPAPAHTMHVTVSGRGVRSREGIQAHSAHLHPHDAARKHGIPVTSPARTLLDLATTVSHKHLDRAVNEARVHRLVSDHSLNEQFIRYPRHRGTRALKHAMRIEPALTRSEAEKLALDLIRAARLPTPETNVMLHGWEVDLLWREQRLAVESDSYAFHSSRRSFERDRRKDRELSAEGYVVLRLTWRELIDEPAAIVATLAAALTRPAGSRR
jgi:very-short-patch-repair endonuclease